MASILFLDVEGAFPNAVTDQLLHNLRKQRIPNTYIKFITQLLTNRRTKIKFNDYISEMMEITNGIGQGDPLSMLLYILYNADLLKIPDTDQNEDALGYIDDIAFIAIGDNYHEMTAKLKNIMEKQNGGLDWSKSHNSHFEITKLVILHTSRRTIVDPEVNARHVPLPKLPLEINNQIISEVPHYKYLGILIDSQLRWKEQDQKVVANATKWLLQFR